MYPFDKDEELSGASRGRGAFKTSIHSVVLQNVKKLLVLYSLLGNFETSFSTA